jgi:chemotaxis protein MotB
MKQINTLLIYACTLFFTGTSLTSCVTARRYDEMSARAKRFEESSAECQNQLAVMEEEKKRLQATINDLTTQTAQLRADTTRASELYRRNKVLLDDLFSKYDRLDRSYNQLLANSAAETGNLTKNLTQKEQELLAMEQNLLANKARVDKLSSDLQAREQRVAELEKILQQKEQAVNDLRNRVSEALLSFKNGELSVDIRHGKVYVSLSEQLLFKSGSYTVDAKGVDALKKLANVLKSQSEINVLVEGHTDDVPVSKGSSCIDDNWDLSVLRATSIVNVLTGAGVPANRLTAAGRGEFLPVASGKTAEARQKNRRTEIILSPKLDELFQLLEAN